MHCMLVSLIRYRYLSLGFVDSKFEVAGCAAANISGESSSKASSDRYNNFVCLLVTTHVLKKNTTLIKEICVKNYLFIQTFPLSTQKIA
jgi:hypothetical protein